MKRRICAWMLAAAAALSLTTPVTAAVSRKIVNPVHFYADKDGDGICDNFTDKNKDGICDNCAWGRGQGRYAGRDFADENGDGICDDISIKYLRVFSIIDISYQEYLNWKQVLPYYRNISEEGIILYAA